MRNKDNTNAGTGNTHHAQATENIQKIGCRQEPSPIPTQSRPIWELVIEDMKARDAFGRKHYGTPLQAFNGRNALIDLYQELLDACVYTRQLIEEQVIEAAYPIHTVCPNCGRKD